MGPRAGLGVVEKRRLLPPGIRTPDSPTHVIVCEPTTMSRLPPCCKGYAVAQIDFPQVCHEG